jgi:hypothetical protein
MQNNLLEKSLALELAVEAAISNQLAPTSRNGLIAAGSYDFVRELHRSVNFLVEKKHFGSAFALLRTMLDGCLIGLWATYLASNDEIVLFENNRLTPEPSKILQRLKLKDDGVFAAKLEQIYLDTKQLLNGYVHGGLVQISNRIGEDFIGPNYTEEEICHSLTLSNSMLIIAVLEISTLRGDAALEEELKHITADHVGLITVAG